MRQSASRLRDIFRELKKMIQPGVATSAIDKEAEALIAAKQAKPAFKGYRGFPACACTSLNEVVVHGIPSKKRILKNNVMIALVDQTLFYTIRNPLSFRKWVSFDMKTAFLFRWSL